MCGAWKGNLLLSFKCANLKGCNKLGLLRSFTRTLIVFPSAGGEQ